MYMEIMLVSLKYALYDSISILLDTIPILAYT